MTNKTEMVRVPRGLLERLISATKVARGEGSPTQRDAEAILAAPISCRACSGTGGFERLETCNVCKGKGTLPAPVSAPAEDVRAVGEEPVYLFTDEQGMPGWTDRWDVAKHLPYDVEKVYRHPQRPVAPQCSEVAGQCSEHLRTQRRAVVLPERLDPNNAMSEPYNPDSWNARIDELERLNK